ncbi:hypothetical protein IFM89_038332 [Coptis chinensis]|uniref:Polygalacturonase n=1 Tax=Coptis chinensis TaxID=261450 RepID=A0A835HTD3_9MAGN|nr:hypothetical protein IFM89_038332 [Coptis chinensis]
MVARSSSIISDQGAEVQGLSTGVGNSATGGTDVQGLSSTVGDNVTGAGNDQQLLSGLGTFNVKDYGVKGDGKTDHTKSLNMKTGLCVFVSRVFNLLGKLHVQPQVHHWIPKGTYLIGSVKFNGPCKNAKTITVQLEASFIYSSRTSFHCNKVLILEVARSMAKELKHGRKISVPRANNAIPFLHPNTDGIHIEWSSGISVVDSHIGTGDDCISIGHGNTQITVTGVTCGPGHGISVGSLGRYPKEQDVCGIIVKGCTLTGTMNGIRIKTWENSPGPSTASNMTFDDIIMNNVGNPIIIDQTYCPFSTCAAAVRKLGNHFRPSSVFMKNLVL